MKHNKVTPYQIQFAHLTDDGKLLFHHPALGWVVVNQAGHHSSYLHGVDDALLQECTPVRILRPLFYIPPRPYKREGRWEYLLSTRVSEDFSNFHPDRCNNGGCYGYWEEDLLFAQLTQARNGRAVTKFAAVRVCRTTADFDYTDSGEFQRLWQTTYATDTVDEFAYTESGRGELDAPLEDFPTFRWLTPQDVLDAFPAREVSRALLKKGSTLSFTIGKKYRVRPGRRVRRVRG